ncbi:MAG: hypothetical protein ACYSWU_20525, partial [Planctomycetota bacterium]
VGFDKDGNELFRHAGIAAEVEIPESQWPALKGGTVTHNHPVFGEGEFKLHNVPLSGADGHLLKQLDLAEIRAVTDDFTFSLSVKEGAPQKTPKQINAAWQRRRKKLEDAHAAETYELLRGKKITPLESRKRNVAYQEEAQHQAWVDIADRHGLVYKREKR